MSVQFLEDCERILRIRVLIQLRLIDGVFPICTGISWVLRDDGHPPPERSAKAIHVADRAPEQRLTLAVTRLLGQSFECVPAVAVRIRALVDREVALEHASIRAEQFDASVHPRLPRLGKLR